VAIGSHRAPTKFVKRRLARGVRADVEPARAEAAVNVGDIAARKRANAATP
jgi:hypothetical protein